MAKAPAPLNRTEQIAVQKRNRMAVIENQYLEAKKYEKGDVFFTDQLRALAKVRAIVRQGLMENAESLLIMGRIQQVLLDTYHHENVIQEYEQLKASLQEQFPE